jgi:predicted secreted Zn-dependent protease
MAGLDLKPPWFIVLRFAEGGSMKRLWGVVAVMAAFGVSCGAVAKPVQTTRYTYYTVSGDSAVEIYDAMIRRGPNVNGAKAYAATSATTTQDGKLLQSSSCQIKDYRLNLSFVIKLPKIKNEKVLPAADRKQWRNFSAFLKAHEETHRQIWLDCAEDLEAKVKAIKARSCSDADAKATKLWDKMRAACSKKHEAFDKAEQKRLMSHPFVRLVYRRSTASHGAKAQ